MLSFVPWCLLMRIVTGRNSLTRSLPATHLFACAFGETFAAFQLMKGCFLDFWITQRVAPLNHSFLSFFSAHKKAPLMKSTNFFSGVFC
jgi:hypothetical protein